MDNNFRNQLVELLPELRAFARFLSKRQDTADDLVQDVVVKALHNQHQFVPGTNMKSWLFTILRNHFYGELRKLKSHINYQNFAFTQPTSTNPEQESKIEFHDFQNIFLKLCDAHREALVLVGGSGFSYEEAAEICNCAVGTMKSRVSRARAELNRMMNGENNAEKALSEHFKEPSF